MMHNYLKKIAQMIKTGELPPGVSVDMVDIYHDDYCSFWMGGECDCDPDIEIKRLWSPGEEHKLHEPRA
jgi:hypothetical protein